MVARVDLEKYKQVAFSLRLQNTGILFIEHQLLYEFLM